MWKKSENSEATRPAEIEVSGNTIILRRRFERVEVTEDMPEHFEYEEWQMTKDQYEVYQNFETIVNEQSDALVELAEIISEVM